MICCNFYYMYQNLENCVCAQKRQKFTDDSDSQNQAGEKNDSS